MTIYSSWQVGDKLRFCAGVGDFCGSSSRGLALTENNVDKSSNPCPVAGSISRCLSIDNIGITFRLVRSSGSAQCSSCQPLQVYREIGTARTDSRGVAALEYTVTEQDRLDYERAKASGDPYKLMTCITDDRGQGIGNRGKCSDYITISQGPAEEKGQYRVTLWYWDTPFVKNSGEKIKTLIETLWNQNTSNLAGWNLISVNVDIGSKTVTLDVLKAGSITYDQFVAVLKAMLIVGPLNLIAFVIGMFIYRFLVEKIGHPAYDRGYNDGFEAGKEKAKEAIDTTDLSPENKKKAKDAIDKIQPDPGDRERSWEKYKQEATGAAADAVKIPTLNAPSFALVDREIELSGECDPNFKVEIYRDDKFSIFDIFRGNPLALLDDRLAETTSDAKGQYSVKYKFGEQSTNRIYAKTGGLESARKKIYVLETATALLIIVLVAVLTFITIRKFRRK